MFSNKDKSKPTSEFSKEQNRISAGTIITGDIQAKGGFRIEGTLKGTLKTAGKVVISKGGFINGNLNCQDADFEGKFSGKLIVEQTLTLRATAVIEGEVIAGKLAIEPGAAFNASCEMKGAVKSLKKESENGKQEEKSA
jgi:cytoskeletal protein CcmA (bactofilin family)